MTKACCILAAGAVLTTLLFPVTLTVLAVYGVVIGCKKCKKKCNHRRKERKRRKLLEMLELSRDVEVAETLGMIVIREKSKKLNLTYVLVHYFLFFFAIANIILKYHTPFQVLTCVCADFIC